ncbi:hypothetical protein BDR07DRAFT_1450800 [Suillus spraguei]|nr:hypothetical protein BDR07DRAFT_1450800 [Suillus spraguei]
MHFSCANMASLFMDLWCGVADCHTVTDYVADWDWAVLIRNTWEAHGKAVAATHTHLPGSFDVPPQNPAQKMHSFYKARELLYGILPLKYFQHYCKFVQGLHIMSQYHITTAEMIEACICFSEWEEEFERIYYQRHVDQIHFIRPCVHLANHLAAEGTHQTIGNIEFDLCQPSNTMSNFMEICVMSDALHPWGSFDVGNGYVLLRVRNWKPRHMPAAQATLISNFLVHPAPPIRCWSQLHLPHVLCFTQLAVEAVADEDDNDNEDNNKDDKDDEIPKLTWANVAMISVYSRPDQQPLDLSHGTVWLCTHGGNKGLQLIDVRMITAVVVMIPHRPTLPSGVMEDRYFMVEKLDLMSH